MRRHGRGSFPTPLFNCHWVPLLSRSLPFFLFLFWVSLNDKKKNVFQPKQVLIVDSEKSVNWKRCGVRCLVSRQVKTIKATEKKKNRDKWGKEIRVELICIGGRIRLHTSIHSNLAVTRMSELYVNIDNCLIDHTKFMFFDVFWRCRKL